MVKVEHNKKKKNLIGMWSLQAGDCFESFGDYPGIYIKSKPILNLKNIAIKENGLLTEFRSNEQVLFFPYAVLNTNEEE